jgi:hypothetical protein
MKPSLERLFQVGFHLCALLIVVTATLFIKATIANGEVASTSDSKYHFPNLSSGGSSPVGYDAEGMPARLDLHQHSGWAVRFASPHCHYSQQDEPTWRRLSSELNRRGVPIYIIVPTQTDAYPKDYTSTIGAVQLSYVDMEWLRRFRLTGTPTVLLFNREGGLVWSHRGLLHEKDASVALGSIAALGAQ